jgi:hypothetical protein
MLYYAIGALGAILAALLTQFGTNMYLYMSMFFAYAILNPENQILLFFVIPVKMKWLALLNAAFYIYALIIGSWTDRAAVLFSLLNVILFFGGDIINLIKNSISQWKRRQSFKYKNR